MCVCFVVCVWVCVEFGNNMDKKNHLGAIPAINILMIICENGNSNSLSLSLSLSLSTISKKLGRGGGGAVGYYNFTVRNGDGLFVFFSAFPD